MSALSRLTITEASSAAAVLRFVVSEATAWDDGRAKMTKFRAKFLGC